MLRWTIRDLGVLSKRTSNNARVGGGFIVPMLVFILGKIWAGIGESNVGRLTWQSLKTDPGPQIMELGPGVPMAKNLVTFDANKCGVVCPPTRACR